MRLSSVDGTPVVRTVLIRLKLRYLFTFAGLAVFSGGGAVIFGFGDPTGWLPEMLGPVGRSIFAMILGVAALGGVVALVGGLITRLECVVAYGDHTLFMPMALLSPAFWVPWLRDRGMVPIDLRNATLETRRRPGQVVIVIRSGNTRVESYLEVSSWDEEDMWRRWAEFQASLHGVDMDSLPPNALRPDKSAYEVAREEWLRKEKRYWDGFILVGLLALLVFWLLFLVLENPNGSVTGLLLCGRLVVGGPADR